MRIIGVSTTLSGATDTTVRDLGTGTVTLAVGGMELNLPEVNGALAVINTNLPGNLAVELVAANVMRISIK